MNNPISDFTDELEEAGKDIIKHVAREVKDMGKIAKGQIAGESRNKGELGDQGERALNKQDKKNQEIDPVTGLPPIKKKSTLTQLTQATAQLRMAKLKKLREELEKQRLKVSDKKSELAPIESQKSQGHGPAMTSENSEREKVDDSVAVALKGSKDTGEFKGLIGG